MMFGLSNTVINDICNILKTYPDIELVYIFGSRAKGNYKEGSDIDLAIVGEDISFNQIMDISNKIEDLELLYNIDIVNYKDKINTPIGEHIERVKQIFYQKETK